VVRPPPAPTSRGRRSETARGSSISWLCSCCSPGLVLRVVLEKEAPLDFLRCSHLFHSVLHIDHADHLLAIFDVLAQLRRANQPNEPSHKRTVDRDINFGVSRWPGGVENADASRLAGGLNIRHTVRNFGASLDAGTE